MFCITELNGIYSATDNAELVFKLYARKQSTYFVNKVYPNLGLKHLDFDVIRREKKMAMSRVENHPWSSMDEVEILRSSGVILTDPDTGKEGITLAAILVFGKDSTIMSVLPQYKTDAIYRVKNLDRYDDRELVSNILAHRDYSNGYTAQFVIERDKLYTKNSNWPHGHGELQLNKFDPFLKNPPISKVFIEIDYADELGSGMRNTNKYTKLYSGGTPKFVEENTFEIIIPIEKVPELQVGGNGTQDGTQERIIKLMAKNPKVTRKAMAEELNISVRILQRVLNNMPNIHYVGTGANGHWEVDKKL